MKKFLLTCIAVACSLVAVAEELLIEAESFSQRGGLRVRIGRKVNGIATTIETGEVFQGKGGSPCFQYCLSGKLPLPGITGMS